MVICKASGFEPAFISTNKLRNLPYTCRRDQEKGPGLLLPPRVHRGHITMSLRCRELKENLNQRGAPQVGTLDFSHV